METWRAAGSYAEAARRLNAEGITPVMYDKNSYPGGHTASFRSDSGFTFDLGPHISYTKDPRIQDLLADSVDQRYETLKINLNNYWRGCWPKHPVQQHLHGLPEETIVKVISDFVAEAHAPERTINNYEDWLLASFGRTFAEHFPMEYGRKYHTTEAANMGLDWLGPRLYQPALEEVLAGVKGPAGFTGDLKTHEYQAAATPGTPSTPNAWLISERLAAAWKAVVHKSQ